MLLNPTINQQLKNRMLNKNAFLTSERKKIFKPSSAHQAREAISGNEERMMHQNKFGYSKYLALDAKHQK
jgi:hypothetical protein